MRKRTRERYLQPTERKIVEFASGYVAVCRLTPDQKEFKRMTFFNTWNDSTMEKENRKLCEKRKWSNVSFRCFQQRCKEAVQAPSSQQRVVINVLGEQGVRILRQIPAITHIKKIMKLSFLEWNVKASNVQGIWYQWETETVNFKAIHG